MSNFSSNPNHLPSMNDPAMPSNESQDRLVPGMPGTPLAKYAPLPSTPHAAGGGERAHSHRLPTGTILSGGRYRIERLEASGGMGAVYMAIDTRFNRPCAVKEMLDEFHTESEHAQAVEWFSREATLLLDLNHPCIPHVRDFFVEHGRHYLVMDFIEGRTLAEVLEQDAHVLGVNGARGVTEERARDWLQQLCNVLGYLHRQTPPIIFRDLKPSNIMLTRREEIKLIDFGIARTFASQRQSTVIMTLGYAPPEQLQGLPEPRSDIFALGATMHKMLTRHEASNNKPTVFSFPPLRTLRPDITPAFEQIIMKALAVDIEQRWASTAELERVVMNLPPIVAAPTVGPGGPSSSQDNLPPVSSGPYTPNSLTPPSGPSITPMQSSAGTTGPAGKHIIAAQEHLAAVPPRVDAAYEAVKWAFGYEPNNALVHKLFGQVFARRVPPQVELAMKAYNRSLQLNPDDAETHKLVGDISLFIVQQPFNSIPAYIQSLRLNTNDFETHQRLAMCYEKTNQLESALHEYQEAARLSPKQPGIQFTLGQLAMRLGRYSIAEQAFVQVLFMNPSDYQTRFLLSQVYEQENKLEEAFRECSYVVGPLSANPSVLQMYQRLRTRLGR